MPEGVDRRAGEEIAADGSRSDYVFIAEGGSEQADEERGQAWDDGEAQALGEGVRHRRSLRGGEWGRIKQWRMRGMNVRVGQVILA